MTKQNAISRRGTAILAAAFSLAMVGTIAPAVTPDSPLVPPASAQDPAPAAGSDKAIYSPGQASEKGTISGSVKEIVEAAVGFGTVQDSGRPIAGVKVYAQWYEGVNTEHSSPVYYTESDANGNFTIKMGPYTDAAGVTREFEADASVGVGKKQDHAREKIRVWTELPDSDTDKYRLMHQPAVGIFPNPAVALPTTPNTQGDGQWTGNRVTGMTIQYVQKDKLPQHLPENEWVESVGKSSNRGNYAGQAFWNLDVLQGGLSHNVVSKFDPKDVAAPGLKVVASYLNDEAVTKIEQYAKDNFAGKTLRGRGWTPADEEGLQRWINEQVAADPEGWIAETVYTTTGADGRFQLFWKGLYGNNHTGTGGGINPPADKLHKLAGAWDEGSWLNGNSTSKHVNMDWSYLSVYGADGNELPDNIGVMHPWSLGRWMGLGSGGGDAQYFGGDGAFIEATTDGYTGWNIALAPQSLKFDVVDKNTTDNWATVGDTVQTDTSGLPITQDLSYYIQWVDKNGKVVKTCETAKADAATKIPSCPFEVPADAQTGDTFTARLKLADGDPNPEDDLVLALDAFAVAREYLEYNEVEAKQGVAASAMPKFDNPATDFAETKPEKASFRLGTLPEGVTKDQVSVDPMTGVVTFTPNADQVGKTFKFPVEMRNEDLRVPVLDKNGNPRIDKRTGKPITQGRVVAHADAPFKVADTTAATVEPEYEGKLVVPGVETKSAPSFTDKDGQDVTVPEGSKFAVDGGFTVPEGYEVSIDESTGEITVSFPDGSKLNKDTVEEFDVPVTVTYKDGTTDEVKANFKLDTDGDGTPDTTDEDDDNDGIPDGDDSNPKVPNQNTIYEPEYEGKLVVPGVETKSAPSFTDKDGQGVDVPEGSKFAVDGGFTAPEGYVVEIDPNTGEITVTFPDKSKLNKDTTEEFDVPVTVTYPDGSTDKADANFKLDTDNDGKPDTTDEDDDNDGIPDEEDSNPKVPNQNTIYEPEYEGKLVVPGEETKSSPSFTDKDGQGVDVPEGSKFAVDGGFKAPEGYEVSIDESTGEITVSFPDGSKLNKDTVEEFDVPVTVTYKDGTTDEVKANFKLDTDGDGTPDTTDEDDDNDGIPDGDDSNPKVPNQNTIYEPEYTDGSGKPGSEVTVPAPTFTDKDGKDATPPEGTKFTPGEGTPDGVTIDENTGEIKVTIPEDATPGSKIEVPVVVTYPDGTKDNVDVTITVEQPEVKDNEKYEPEYDGGSGKPGDEVTVDKPTFKDGDGNEVTPPEGTTFTPGEGTPDGATVNEDGSITVTIPEDAKPGDKIEVPVVVTYPDGTTDEVTVTVTVEQPEVKDNEKYEPEYDGGSGKPGDQVTVDKPTFKDGDRNEVTPPEGTTFTPGEGTPDGATVNEDGSITVTIPEDATPGDKIEVPVVVTYPDGTTDEVTVTITVTEKDATPVTPGEPTEHNPSLGASADDPADCELPPFVTVEKTEGVVYKVTVDGKELTPDAEGKYVYAYGQTVKVEATPAQGFTFPEGAKTTWTYTTAQNEICNVPDVPETKDNEKFEPEYEDGTGKPGEDVTVDKPTFKDGDGNEVTPPEGTKFTPGEGTPDGVTVNEDGSIKVTIPEDAKPGDKITVPVIVTYPDGTKDNVDVTVTVGEPDTKTPDWKDGSGEPGGKVVIPNDGGPVDDGTTVETDGPGKAEIDDDGNLVVDIDDNAKPGDKIVVIVKDKDGNEIDRVTVTVEKPAAGDTTEKVVQKPKLARTGVQVAGLAGIAAAMGAAGLGLAFMRRRREDEEN
ncbi:YPDG domain-containing protein [Actinomyces urinae]|uniref:YPDG domain-containing protein n=1 Tax=Actinomyces urinae TaxID=1689268 RepID=UPI00092FEABC|nr:YPDG domain-containing protein [Actinomyces urinae]